MDAAAIQEQLDGIVDYAADAELLFGDPAVTLPAMVDPITPESPFWESKLASQSAVQVSISKTLLAALPKAPGVGSVFRAGSHSYRVYRVPSPSVPFLTDYLCTVS